MTEWPDHVPPEWTLAPPAPDPDRHRRQQRLRAIIAWSTGVVAVGLIVLAAILAPTEEEDTIHFVSSGYKMTAAQYADLEDGLDEGEFLDRLGQTGLAEAETPLRLVALFPPHEAGVTCSFWVISDHLGRAARVCFDDDGELVQKLERGSGEESSGVSA